VYIAPSGFETGGNLIEVVLKMSSSRASDKFLGLFGSLEKMVVVELAVSFKAASYLGICLVLIKTAFFFFWAYDSLIEVIDLLTSRSSCSACGR